MRNTTRWPTFLPPNPSNAFNTCKNTWKTLPKELTTLYSSSNNLYSNSKQTVLEDSDIHGTKEKPPGSITFLERNLSLFLEPNSIANR